MNKHHSKLSQPSLPTTSRSLSRVSEKSLPVPAHPSSSKSSRHKMTNPDLTNPIFDDDLNVNVSVNQTMPYSLPQYTSVKSCVTTTTQSKYDTIPQYMSTAPSLPSSSSVRNYHRQTVNPNLFPPQPPSVSSGFEKSDINQANQNLEDVLNVNVSVNQSSVPQSTSVTTTVTSTSQSRFIYDNNTSSNFSRAQQVIPPYNSAEVNNYMPPGSFQNKNKFTGATSVASYPKEDENNFAEVNPTRSHDPRTCSKKNCSGKGCGKKCPKKVCIMEPSSQNIPRTDLSQGITNTSSQSHLPLHSTGRTQSSKLFPSNQSFAGNVESPHFPKSNSFPSPSQFSSSRRMHTSKTDIGRTAEMSHTSISNNIHQIPSTRIEASQLSHLKPNLADQSNPPPSLDSQLGEKTFHSTFTSIGIPVLSYDATYTVVRLNEGKAITNTTLSIQDSNVHSSSSEQALSYVSGVERISKHPKNNSNRIVNPSSVRGKVQPTSAPLSQRNADFQTSGYSSEFQNQQPSIINSSGQNIYQNYETMQHPAHTSKCNVRQVSFKNLQDVQTDKSSDVSIPSHCKNYRRDDFNSPILQSGAYPSTAQYGLNLYSNEQKELPAHKSTWSHQNRDESRFSTRPLRKQETTVVTNIVRNPESGKS
ncbi:hypothetical protein C0J52_07361 [Blattella germanica]|nr:hypothetical protein C0J52_07361 [Blattella germanica]